MTYSFFMLMALIQNLSAQKSPPVFEEFVIEDGFASVNCIFRDSEGFMWFGGTHGLYRYDGYAFKTFFASDQDSSSLSNNNVVSIFQDREGLIWIGTMHGGVNCYDPVTETFLNHRNTPAFVFSAGHYVTTITQDEEGLIWIGTFGEGIYNYDKQYRIFSNIKKSPLSGNTISNDDVFSIVTEGENIWITTNAGMLDCYNKAENRFYHYPYSSRSHKSSRSGQRMVKDNQGNIWIATEEEGIFRFNKKSKTFQQYRHHEDKPSVSTDNITDIRAGKSGEIWVTTGDGLNFIHPQTNEIKVYKRGVSDDRGITNNIAYCLFIDEYETLWMGMGNGTVNKTTNSPFKIYQASYAKNNSLSVNAILSLFLKDHTLWIGTGGGGLDEFDLNSRVFKNYNYNARDKGSIPSSIVMSVLEDEAHNLWTGNSTHGIIALKKNGTSSFTEPEFDLKGTQVSVFDLADDHDGHLWIATYNQGLFSYDKGTGNYVNYQSTAEGLLSNKLLRLLCDTSGKLWIGSLDKGVQVYDLNKEKFMTLRESGFANAPSIKHPVKDIYEDRDGNTWVATEGEGVYKLYAATGEVTRMGTENGLPGNSVYGIIQDHQGDFWFCTNKGVANLKSNSGKVVNYNTNNGLPTNDFESGATAIAADGELFFGSKKGLISFYPESLEPADAPVNLKLTGFRIFNNEVNVNGEVEGIVPLDTAITYKKHLRLPYFLDNFTMEFAPVGHPNPHNIKYEFRLEGLDERWISTSSERNSATYSNVPAGHYIFRVRAYEQTATGSPRYFETRVAITIVPVWWQAPPAFLCYALLLFGLIWFVYQSVRNKVRFNLLHVRVNNLQESRRLLREKLQKEVTLKPKDIAINHVDERFLEKVMELIEKNLSNPEYVVSTLAKDIGMSHSVLYRKMKALTSRNINDFMKSMRLKRAVDLLLKSDHTINEISDMTGFSNARYFSTCFRKEYQQTPSKYRKLKNKANF